MALRKAGEVVTGSVIAIMDSRAKPLSWSDEVLANRNLASVPRTTLTKAVAAMRETHDRDRTGATRPRHRPIAGGPISLRYERESALRPIRIGGQGDGAQVRDP